jgi:transcriptional regulator with XRE-family HTH domain
MKAQEWFREKLKEFREDFDFRLGSIILDLTEQISLRMRAQGISRSALADKLGVTPAAVTKILRGNSNFTLRTLLSLADALDSSLTVGFGEEMPCVVSGPSKVLYLSSDKAYALVNEEVVGPEPISDSLGIMPMSTTGTDAEAAL